MKTKTQLKNTNSKRSIAMKKSWGERRNSPMREQARQRELAKLNGFIPVKKVTQRVTHDDMLSDFLKLAGPRQVRIEEGMATIGRAINEIRSMVRQPVRQLVGQLPQRPIRRAIATHMMAGLLAASLNNPMNADAKAMAAKSYELADALIEAEYPKE